MSDTKSDLYDFCRFSAENLPKNIIKPITLTDDPYRNTSCVMVIDNNSFMPKESFLRNKDRYGNIVTDVSKFSVALVQDLK